MGKEMKYLLRVDDFPHGHKDRWNEGRITDNENTNLNFQNSLFFIDIFERNQTPFILGVTPFLMTEADIEFFNKNLKIGKVVMHGFDHGFSLREFGQWESIVSDWENGGEFKDLSEKECLERYRQADEFLKQIKNYNPKDFIAPFNCYTQNLLNAFQETEVETIHTQKTEYDKFNYNELNYGKLEVNISPNELYNHSPVVLDNLKNGHTGTIVLHWIFDSNQECYDEISKFINQNNAT
tara:strand:- start:780 stop:1493 length:714 start_codon:yes stop_codon:yes gene_type:complete